MTNRLKLRTYIHEAFFARDKASLAKIVKDAEEAAAADPDAGDDTHQEPDGDEGKHASNVHVHIEHKGGTGDTIDARVAKLEDGMKSIDSKLTKIADAIAKDAGDDDKDDKETKDAKDDGDDEDDDDKKKTDDVEAPDGETGALSAEKLAEAEPELMNADPALKTGKMQMGDAKYVEAINRGLKLLVKDIRARAEVLSPGIKLTMDAKPGKATQKALCDARRTVLTKAIATDSGKAAVGSFTAADIKGMSCEMARTVFKDASERMKASNNRNQSSGGTYVASDSPFVARDAQVEKLKQINQANHDFWSKQTGAVRH